MATKTLDDLAIVDEWLRHPREDGIYDYSSESKVAVQYHGGGFCTRWLVRQLSEPVYDDSDGFARRNKYTVVQIVIAHPLAGRDDAHDRLVWVPTDETVYLVRHHHETRWEEEESFDAIYPVCDRESANKLAAIAQTSLGDRLVVRGRTYTSIYE